jgi:hypothetical protein
MAGLRFAKCASGDVYAFTTNAKKQNKWGYKRAWWRLELPTLLKNSKVTGIIRMKRDGNKVKTSTFFVVNQSK